MDKVIGVAEARSKFPALLRDVAAGKRYIVTQRSKARAVLMSPEEVETLEILADKNLMRDIRAAKEDVRLGRYKTYEDFRKGLGR